LSSLTNDLNPRTGQLIALDYGMGKLNNAVAPLNGSLGTINSSLSTNSAANASNLYGTCLGSAGANAFRCTLP
jgi:hypothetical protein